MPYVSISEDVLSHLSHYLLTSMNNDSKAWKLPDQPRKKTEYNRMGSSHNLFQVSIVLLLWYSFVSFCFLEINAYMLNILQHISKMPIAIKVIWFYFSLTWIKNRKGNIGKNITWHKFVHKNNHAEDTEYVQII